MENFKSLDKVIISEDALKTIMAWQNINLYKVLEHKNSIKECVIEFEGGGLIHFKQISKDVYEYTNYIGNSKHWSLRANNWCGGYNVLDLWVNPIKLKELEEKVKARDKKKEALIGKELLAKYEKQIVDTILAYIDNNSEYVEVYVAQVEMSSSEKRKAKRYNIENSEDQIKLVRTIYEPTNAMDKLKIDLDICTLDLIKLDDTELMKIIKWARKQDNEFGYTPVISKGLIEFGTMRIYFEFMSDNTLIISLYRKGIAVCKLRMYRDFNGQLTTIESYSNKKELYSGVEMNEFIEYGISLLTVCMKYMEKYIDEVMVEEEAINGLDRARRVYNIDNVFSKAQ